MVSGSTTVRVRYAETDKMGIVYHANFFVWFEIGRTELVRQRGIPYSTLEQAEDRHIVVANATCTYRAPARYDDLLTIRTTLSEWPTDHRLRFRQEVFNADGKLLTVGDVLLYFLRSATMERTPMPKEMAEKLKPFFT